MEARFKGVQRDIKAEFTFVRNGPELLAMAYRLLLIELDATEVSDQHLQSSDEPIQLQEVTQ